MSRRTLAALAVPAALLLPVTVPGVAEAAPTATAGTHAAAKPAPTAAQRARLHRLHVLHLRTLANLRAAKTARARVLAAARSAIGRPYVYGAAGPRSFDCSGLTQWTYKAAGKRLPRTAAGQARAGHTARTPRPGDLLVYRGAAHVALVYAVRAGRVVDTIVARHSGTTITHQRPYAGVHGPLRPCLTGRARPLLDAPGPVTRHQTPQEPRRRPRTVTAAPIPNPTRLEPHVVTCELCADRLPAAAILDHLAITHHVTLDVQTWPDGQPVIHDETLTPKDFT